MISANALLGKDAHIVQVTSGDTKDCETVRRTVI